MASFASSATTGGARKHAWTKRKKQSVIHAHNIISTFQTINCFYEFTLQYKKIPRGCPAREYASRHFLNEKMHIYNRNKCEYDPELIMPKGHKIKRCAQI